MPMLFDDTAILTALDADILAAWSPAAIHHSPPLTVDTALPRGFIHVANVPIERGAMRATPKEVNQHWEYVLTGQFALPTSTTTLHEEQVARAQELITRLTAADRYAGWWRNVTLVEFDHEPTEGFYEVAVTFTLDVTAYA